MKTRNLAHMHNSFKKVVVFLLLLILVLSCLPVPTEAATKKPISNGYYMIAPKKNTNYVWDIHNFSMNNGGNLEIYNKKESTNQIFYFCYDNYSQSYTIRCLHSGYYLHKANSGRTNDVHQWQGYGADNTKWFVESAGWGYYYIRSKCGGYIDNSNGMIRQGNNVGTYQDTGTNQKWKFIKVKKLPEFRASVKNTQIPTGTYTNPGKFRINQTVTSTNYPIVKAEQLILNSSKKTLGSNEFYPAARVFDIKNDLKMSSLANGTYYYQVKIWNSNGVSMTTPLYAFTIKKAEPVKQVSSPIPIDKKITVYKQTDSRWKDHLYGYSSEKNREKGIHAYLGQDNKNGTGSGGGCGVLSVVNAVYYLKGTFIQPKELADFAVSTNARYDGGTYGWLAEKLCEKKGTTYGIKFVTDVKKLEDAKPYLIQGNVATVHVEGHFMALVNYNPKDDTYLVIDSFPSGKRGTLNGYRWLKASEFTGRMKLSMLNEKKGSIHIISRR